MPMREQTLIIRQCFMAKRIRRSRLVDGVFLLFQCEDVSRTPTTSNSLTLPVMRDRTLQGGLRALPH
jgi:hypothetical protein